MAEGGKGPRNVSSIGHIMGLQVEQSRARGYVREF